MFLTVVGGNGRIAGTLPARLIPEVSSDGPHRAPPTSTTGGPLVNVLIFGVFVVATLVVVLRAAPGNRTASDYYTGGQRLSGPANGIA